MSKYTFEDIWPIGINSLSTETLRNITDQDFDKLRIQLFKRSIKRGFDKKTANKANRELFRLRNGRRSRNLNALSLAMSAYEFRESHILNCFFPNRSKKWLPVQKRNHMDISTLEDFSFIDAPNETMNKLADLVRMESICKAARVNFGDRQLKDVSPYLVLGLLSKEMAPYIKGGKISFSAQKVMQAIDIREFLGMRKFGAKLDEQNVWAFPLKKRHTSGTSGADVGDSISFQLVTDELVDAVNEWLSALPSPRQLSNSAMAKVANIANETLNNAERHSREAGDGDWYMAGFMARRKFKENATVPERDGLDAWYECHLAFVNLGRPISEAILTTPDSNILASIERYCNLHYNSKNKKKQSKSTLATAIAMQDGISSKPENAGGKGIMEVVEVTNQLAYDRVSSRKPKITIISGGSCIKFSEEYSGYEQSGTRGGGRIQPFNPQCDLDISPSTDHVFNLDISFPGTIVAVRFALDPNSMEEKHA